MKSMTTLTKNGRIRFDNRFVEGLPGDPNRSKWPRQVHGACYSRVQPTPVEKPEVVAWSREVAERLDLSAEFVESAQFAQVFGGNQLLDGMDPYAMCYGGHQFGNWAGQLGDGRAINLGTLVNREGEHWTLQLKGAGMTPYSRRGDGLAVLRSSIREFLCSEAMHHLGVPTTRALSLVTTGEKVMRDMFYDGHPGLEPGAIVCRVAPSFIRFGNFQIFASRNELDVLQQLLDYTIRNDFPHLGEPSKEVYAQWFREVAQRTAEMIIHWMRVGFVHGVMNTDNMSILGLTIDYGPYGWLEDYDPNWTPNTTDAQHRRYRFGNQPQIAQWNLVQLGNALVQLTREVEPLQAAINEYAQGFTQGYQEMMARKLGLRAYVPESDKALINDLQQILVLAETDMTIFFRNLADFPANQAPAPAEEPSNQSNQSNQELMAPLLDAYYVPEQLTDPVKEQIGTWLRTYRARLALDNRPHAERRTQMNAVNPKYVLRNYMAQLAIDQAETGDHTLVWELLDLLRHPYHEQPAMQKHAAKRPDWARHRAGCSMLSCSS
ncbi:MAG: protein adenylyltransferase SelO [Ardenticatenaceae bacterium]